MSYLKSLVAKRLKSVSGKNDNGFILWEGVSQIDGVTPVVCIVTGIRKASANGKTGDLMQTWILMQDVNPAQAVRERSEGGVCGDCVHRPQADGKRSCYVNMRTPGSVWRSYKAGNYARLDPQYWSLLGHVREAGIRFGAYGDPGAVPVNVWQSLKSIARFTTGYTHTWRYSVSTYADVTMASCETLDDLRHAESLGYKAFLVVKAGEAKDTIGAGMARCPSDPSLVGVHVPCSQCQGCSGATSRRHRVIEVHGATAHQYRPLRMAD